MTAADQHEGVKSRKALIFTSLGHFTNDGTIFFIPLIIDLLAVAGRVTPLFITLSLTIFYASMALSAILLGPLIDRRSLQVRGMALGIMSLSVGLLLFSVAIYGVAIYFFLILSSVVTGFGASFYHPTGSSILQAEYRGPRLGRYLGINGSAGSLGRALYPTLLLLVSLLFVSHFYSVAFFGILGLIFSLVIFLGMRGYNLIAHENAHENSAASAQPDGKGKTPSSSRAITPAIILLAAISMMRAFAFFGIITWIPEYISFERGIGTSLTLGTTLTLMFSGGIIGQLFFGKLVENHDKRAVLAISTMLSALLMFLYLSTAGDVALAMLIMFGFFNFSGFPIFMSMISDYVPKKGSTTMSNAIVWNLGGTGGQALGPLITGVIIQGAYSNLPIAFEILLLCAIAAALISLKLPRPAKISKVKLFG